MNRTATPCLKPWYRRVYPSTDEVVFISGDHAVRLQGGAVQPLVRPLLPLLDGHHTVDEIVAALGEEAAPAIERAIDTLSARQLLLNERAVAEELPVEAVGTACFLAAAYGAGHDVQPLDVARVIADARLVIVGESALAADMAAVLERSGVTTTRVRGHEELFARDERSEQIDALVVAPSPADEAATLTAVNRWAIRRSRPWMALSPFNGRFLAVGPVFVPPLSCCHACYRERRWLADGVAAIAASASDVEEAPALHSPALDSVACGIATTLLLRWLVLEDPAVVGRMFTLTFGRDLELHGHPVLRLPRCSECSAAGVDASPIMTWFESDGAL